MTWTPEKRARYAGMYGDMELGASIKRARRVRKMKQMELARRVGVSQNALSRYERGVVMPRVATLTLLERELGPLRERVTPEAQEPATPDPRQ